MDFFLFVAWCLMVCFGLFVVGYLLGCGFLVILCSSSARF